MTALHYTSNLYLRVMIKSNKALHNTCCGFLFFLSVAKLSLCIHSFFRLNMASNSYDHTIILRGNNLCQCMDVRTIWISAIFELQGKFFRSYSKTCLKRSLKKNTNFCFQYQISLNAGQKYCRMLQQEHSAIL